ncbi:MAG: hypothetical protein MRY49_02650, partial [Candidatus Pacebacteria bacterium]|nr:hypothetical protein [Candidatus Paceibacterota bacterium]
MKRLIESGLHGNGLIPLETPLLLRRYNDCLKAIGQEPTRLRKIHIDGMGWSPEVAAEKDEVYYLANGEANPYAIIITPDQKGMPIHYPHHSFDRDLIRAIFKVAGKQVSDLTSQTGLWVELDQQFDIYTSPDDLATIDVIIVRVNAVDDLMDVARTQKT